jgi:hypothetical protein
MICYIDLHVHDVNLSRGTHGEFNVLYKQLRNYKEKSVEYLLMTKKKTLDILVTKIKEKIQKEYSNYRACISPEERLVTLR